MKNPISYSDFFKEDLATGLDGLVARVENVEKAMVKMLDEIKVKANEAGRALQSGGDVSALSAQIDNLSKVFDKYIKALEHTRGTKKNMQNANKNETQSVDALAHAYASLDDLLTKTGVDVNQLGLSQKAANSAIKNGEVVAQSATGSYNQLYAQYNLIKAALNAMSQEMRNSTSVGKVWEAQALDIMNRMKAMQANTGNYTLSVGNYEKALNGLNISTQQVLREMPTIANSFSQFIIAISNNVPIFIDNFKRATEELGSMQKAMKAVISSIFSWQTALLVVLTVLPRLIKTIKEKKKAQEEANGAMKEAISYEQLWADAMRDAYQAVVNATNELQVFNEIANDVNRTMDDRIAAGEHLKQVFEDELEGYSAEEIALGRAKEAIDDLTNSLIAQAEARAYLNEIGELSIKLYDLEKEQKDNMVALEEANDELAKQKALHDELNNSVSTTMKGLTGMGNTMQASVVELGSYQSAVTKATEAFNTTQDSIDNVVQTIEDLKKKIDPKYIDFGADGIGKSVKDELLDIPDYYWEMLEVTFGLLEDGLQKELALYDLTYAKESEERAKALKEMEGMLVEANADERVQIEMQMAYLRKMIADEEQLYIKGREDLINEHITTIDAIEAEGADEEEKIRKASMIRLKADMKTRNSIIYDSYEKGNITKAELDRALRDSERQYWEEYLADLRKNGALTLDEYNTIMEKLAKADEKVNSKNKRKARLRNIVEVGFALSSKTGEKDVNGGRKVKDEYLEFADALNKGLELSMDYMDEWMDKRIEMAEVAIEQAKREAEIAKESLDYEQEARANGYANNVEMARKEYEEQLALQRKAEKEKEKLQKAQELIDTATQLSSLVTAVAEIWSAYGGIPIAGPILAAAVTATMFGAFAAAKIQAAKVARAKTYGEGMVEYLDYGGSHASGNDIDFGVDKKGRHRRVERGEMIGVINKRNVDKYGVDTISGIFNSLNKGTYKSDVVEGVNYAIMSDMYGNSFVGGSVTDLSMLEHGVSRLVEQGETKVVAIPNGRIEYKGNNKRIIYSA